MRLLTLSGIPNTALTVLELRRHCWWQEGQVLNCGQVPGRQGQNSFFLSRRNGIVLDERAVGRRAIGKLRAPAVGLCSTSGEASSREGCVTLKDEYE
jgi:hypothetical protein